MPPSTHPEAASPDPPTRRLRVLCVDDNRDGADVLGLLLEELGNDVHVTYGGEKALEVATAFRPDLMFLDLVMPGMDGRSLVTQLRQNPAFASTKIVAITGQKDPEDKSSAIKAGFDSVLLKPVALADIKAILAAVVISDAGPSAVQPQRRGRPGAERRLPIDEARRIRNARPSKTLTQPEIEAAISDGIIRFQEEYLGWRSGLIRLHLIKDLIVVRIRGALTLAERQLGKSSASESGTNLIKQARKQLLEVARPMLESLVHEVAGVKVVSMHHDLSTVTGEEIVIFSLAGTPPFEAQSGDDE